MSQFKLLAAAVIAIGVLFAGIATPALADDKSKPTKPAKPAKPEKPAKPDGKKLPSIQGTIKSVDTDKGSVTVTTVNKKSGTIDQTIMLAKEVQVKVDGTEAKPADLKPGYHVNLKMLAVDRPGSGSCEKLDLYRAGTLAQSL